MTLVFAVAMTGTMRLAPELLPSLCQSVEVASSNEKSTMLKTLSDQYNAEGHFVGGRCIRVNVEQVNSGDAEQLLESRWANSSLPRPDVWSPGSSAWVVLLRQRSAAGATLIPAGYDSLFQSPLIIAMPAPMAAALGYPATSIGWSDIFALVENPAGWGAVGHPEWGKFKLAKTNPNVSTSGLHTLIGTYYAAGGVTPETVNSPTVRAFVAGIESSVVHYGETANAFLSNLRDEDSRGTALEYVSAVAIEEQELVSYNSSTPAPRTSLVAIYPREGVPVADHPYLVLTTSPAKQAAADFYNFIEAQQGTIDKNFFRDRFGNGGPVLAAQQGIATSPFPRLTPPQGQVLGTMLRDWQILRKRARVLIIVDPGGANAAQTAVQLAAAVKGLQPTDQAGVWIVGSPSGAAPSKVLALGPVDPVLGQTLASIRATRRPGDLDDALRAGLAALSSAPAGNTIDALVVIEMSPGTRGPTDLKLESDLRNQPTDHFVRIFTVGPPSERLKALALAGRGTSYVPGAATHFLNDVVSNF